MILASNSAKQNRVELQAMIDNAEFGELTLPPGRFECEPVVIDRDDFTLKASQEWGTSIRTITGSDSFIHCNPSGKPNGSATKRRIKVEGLELLATESKSAAITVSDVSHGHIRDVRLVGYETGISLSTRNNFKIEDDTFVDCGVGLKIPAWLTEHVPQQISVRHFQGMRCYDKAIFVVPFIADTLFEDVVVNAAGCNKARGIHMEGGEGIDIVRFITEQFDAPSGSNRPIELYLENTRASVWGGRFTGANSVAAQIRRKSVVNFFGSQFKQTKAAVNRDASSSVRRFGCMGGGSVVVV